MALKIRKDGAWVNLSTKTTGSITATASGALSAGDPVILNSNGTVSKDADSGSGTNLTVTNFLGFSEASYANNDTATINIISSIDKNQSGGLAHIGKKYYVQGDGALAITPGIPAVEAGIALSSTNILVSGRAALNIVGITRPFNTPGWKIPLVG